MTRKDSEKDSERPHYYSQFWLDVAAGRRVIGAPKGDESEIAEPDVVEPVVPGRRTAPTHPDNDYGDRYNGADADGHHEVIAHPVVDPVISDDDIVEPAELDIINDDADDLDFQDNALLDSDPDMDLEPLDEEENEEDDFFEEEEEEEEEDTGWSRGRKKPSPKRPTKQPSKKPGKRDNRRGY